MRRLSTSRHGRPCPVPPMEPGQRAVYGLKRRTDPEHGFDCDEVGVFLIEKRPVAFVRAQLGGYKYILVFGWKEGLLSLDARVDRDGYMIVTPVSRAERERVRAAVKDDLAASEPVTFW